MIMRARYSMLRLLSCRWNTFWMSDSVNQQHAAAETTAPLHWLTHCYSHTRVVDLVYINLQHTERITITKNYCY